MQEKTIDDAARELLYEACKSGDLMMRLRNGTGDFVKTKRAYVDTDEMRDLYIAALERLIADGKVKQTLGTQEMTVFRLTDAGRNSRSTLESAIAHLLEAAQAQGYIAKVHSPHGEYLYCDEQAFADVDEERIIYLEAFCYLLQHSFIQPTSESKEMTLYSLAEKKPLRKAM